jgi:cytochrome c-type biogenesis protein CcmH
VTSFVLVAALLAALCLAFILPPLLRSRSGREDVDRARANLGVLKDQLAELESDRARGIVGGEQYAEIKAELERRVIEDVRVETPVRQGQARVALARDRGGGAGAAGVCRHVHAVRRSGFARPERCGRPILIPADGHMSGEQLEQVVASLRERLEKEPDNANGWLTLARTLYQMRKFDEAAKAYEKLVEMVSDDASVLADYADAAAMAQGRRFDGKPRDLVARALKLDPTQWKALAMAGTDAFDQGNFRQAIAHWEKLRAQLPPEAPIAQNISQARSPKHASAPACRRKSRLRRRARTRRWHRPSRPRRAARCRRTTSTSGLLQAAPRVARPAARRVGPVAAAPVAPSPAPATAAKPAGGSTVSGTVDLSPDLKAKVSRRPTWCSSSPGPPAARGCRWR